MSAVPAIGASLKYEPIGIKRSNIIPVAVVPNPTITPESPAYYATPPVSLIILGDSINTCGGMVDM